MDLPKNLLLVKASDGLLLRGERHNEQNLKIHPYERRGRMAPVSPSIREDSANLGNPESPAA
jgi:hypothetical protein